MIDDYNHLNDRECGMIDITHAVICIVGMNHGVHRMLSQTVHSLRERNKDDKLAKKLEDILTEGFY